MSQSPAGVFNPVAPGELGPVAPLYFSSLTAPERAIAFMATIDLDAIGSMTSTSQFWVAGVGNPVGVYESVAITLARSQARYATRPLITSSVDTPADTPIEARLAPFDLTRALQFEAGGMIAPLAESAVGTILLQNFDGALDDLDDDVAVVGREVDLAAAAMTGDSVIGSTVFDVLAGSEGGESVFVSGVYVSGVYEEGGSTEAFTIVTEDGFELSTGDGGSSSVLDGFGSIYRGVVEAIGWDRGVTQITVRDFRLKLQQPCQTRTYGGGGGIDGPAELTNVTKPKTLGRCRNVRPTELDRARLIYQFHDGEARAVDAVCDMGVELTALPAVASYAALAALVPADDDGDNDIPLGCYVPCPADGCFRLGGTPAGAVTADVRGAGGVDSLRELFTDGTSFTDGTGFRSAALLVYSRTAGAVIERLLIDAGFTDAEISLSQMAQMDRERSVEVGIYLAAGETRTVGDLVGLCARSMGCVMIRPNDGRYQLREVLPPRDSPVVQIDVDKQDQGKLLRKALPYRQPWSDVDVTFNRNWSPLGAADLAGAVTADRRTLLTRDVFVSRSTSTELAAVYPERAPLRIETALVNDGDAAALGQQLLEFHSRGRAMFSVPARGIAYRLELLDSIRLTAPRFGLDDGRDLVVIGLRENGASLATDLELFG